MSDRRYEILFMDKDRSPEIVRGDVNVQGSVLVITEYYGLSGGVKAQRWIPLDKVREWRTLPQ